MTVRKTAASTRGDQRRVNTRTALLKAGQHLFAIRAVDGVSIDEIVEQAAVAKGSFYNHFQDKDQLAREIAGLVQGDCEHLIYAANRDVADTAARVARALCVMISYALEHPDRTQALLNLSERRTVADAPLNMGVAADVRDGLKSGRFSGMTLESGVVLVIGVIRVSVSHVINSNSATPLRELTAQMGAALLRGLGTPATEADQIARDACTALLPGATS